MSIISSIIRRADLTVESDVPVVFRLGANVSYLATDIVRSDDVRVLTDASGFITTPLAPGYYWVWIRTRPPFRILVPQGDEYYLLKDLLFPGGSGTPTSVLSVGENYRVASATLQLLNATTGNYHPVYLTELSGATTFAIGPADGVLADNYRVTGSCLQFYNVDSETWHALTYYGAIPQLAFGSAGDVVENSFRVSNGLLQLLNTTTGEYHSTFLYGAIPQTAYGPGQS